MKSDAKSLVISVPEPRSLDLIFTPRKLAELQERYNLIETTVDVFDALDEEVLAKVKYVIGQPPISSDTLGKMKLLRAVLNVESNLLDNMPYDEVFARGIHVVTTGSVFAMPVAEMGLGLALDLARGITQADSSFKAGTETWGGDSNTSARLLSGADVGVIGFGDLGRAMNRLLKGFRCNIRVYDPWMPPSILLDYQVTPSSLEDVLQQSDFIFVMAAVTTENQGFLGAEEFAQMRSGAAFILLSRADVVNFDDMLDAVERGQIVAASDVFPQEPLPADHRARRIPGFIGSAHRAGALDVAFKQMGDMVLEDLDLMDRGLPPMRCKRAERETVSRMRSRPVDKN
ncbi:MAG: hydroxyacid dehydrogenase [Roseobacter sp.]|uniref:hydroxyacid dehydrogenase n=1 Tax=Tateyamaria sp. TaxID=1929288 RepID=UPI003269DF7A